MPRLYHTLSLSQNNRDTPGGIHPKALVEGLRSWLISRNVPDIRAEALAEGVEVGPDLIRPWGAWREPRETLGNFTTYSRVALDRLRDVAPLFAKSHMSLVQEFLRASPFAAVQIGTWPAAASVLHWRVSVAPFVGLGLNVLVVLDNAVAHPSGSPTLEFVRTWDRSGSRCGLLIESAGKVDDHWVNLPSLSNTAYFENPGEGRRTREQCAFDSIERIHSELTPYTLNRAETALKAGLSISVALDRLTLPDRQELYQLVRKYQ